MTWVMRLLKIAAIVAVFGVVGFGALAIVAGAAIVVWLLASESLFWDWVG